MKNNNNNEKAVIPYRQTFITWYREVIRVTAIVLQVAQQDAAHAKH